MYAQVEKAKKTKSRLFANPVIQKYPAARYFGGTDTEFVQEVLLGTRRPSGPTVARPNPANNETLYVIPFNDEGCQIHIHLFNDGDVRGSVLDNDREHRYNLDNFECSGILDRFA